LAAALSLRGYPDQELILQEQLSRIQNTDRRQRLLFLLPALSGDTAERDKFFDALKVAAGRKKEAWVLTGLSYLHHPLRTAYSEKYLPQTLALLEEVQRTEQRCRGTGHEQPPQRSGIFYGTIRTIIPS
jgi:aminopeptidase N